ncbi:MAG: flavodoxin family protein [Oscillospiraceae bacterium]|jgi:multimeric flavodoxin WrbA|nr:flavodoxin family protein [Oscillospiraceae bacterium]
MNVLILNSSPRKGGNSDVLCQQFAKGAEEAGHQVEKIDLREKKLSPCLACYACMKEHVCAIRDDMAGIFTQMQQADVIVLSSPVYFYSLSAQLKMLIDRCLVDYKSLAGKKFYFIVTAADPRHEAADETLVAFRGFLRCLPGAEEKGIIYGTGTWDKGDVYKHPAFSQAYQMGKEV